MNVKRTLIIGAGCGVLAAWFSSAATTGNRPRVSVPIHQMTPVEVDGAALAAEIDRLHERLRPTTAPQQPARNLFEFNARRAATRVFVPPPPPPVAESVAPVQQPAPLLKLVGIAEDDSPDGPVRTAIVSGSSELFLVKVGESVTGRYRVASIGADGVELEDVNDGSRLQLILK